jgi:hypothetical protein
MSPAMELTPAHLPWAGLQPVSPSRMQYFITPAFSPFDAGVIFFLPP